MQLEFFLKFPSMERESLRDLKKGIDLTFKDFSREYGDSIEGFFGPLLKFLVWFEKFLITTPWPLIIFLLSFLAWLSSRSLKLSIGTAISFFVIGYFGMWQDTMATLAIISVATLLCISLGIPLGIWMAKSNRVQSSITPVLDVMQGVAEASHRLGRGELRFPDMASKAPVFLEWGLRPVTELFAHYRLGERAAAVLLGEQGCYAVRPWEPSQG